MPDTLPIYQWSGKGVLTIYESLMRRGEPHHPNMQYGESNQLRDLSICLLSNQQIYQWSGYAGQSVENWGKYHFFNFIERVKDMC